MSPGFPRKSSACIAVDLTPVLPGGENGGAKLMTLELLKRLSLIADEWKFVLLTSEKSHSELAILDAHNVRRICIHHSDGNSVRSTAVFPRVVAYARQWFSSILPLPVKIRLGYLLGRAVKRVRRGSLLSELNADLLFCPFTAPLLYDPAVPVVSVVYDLQYRDYPQFFDSADRYHRHRHFMEACRYASRIICISDFVRSTVIRHGNVPPERVKTVYIQLPHRLRTRQLNCESPALSRFSVQKNQFILYPANFWHHKNHNLLLTAYGIYLAGNPEPALKLVCTGVPNARMEYMRVAARKMGLEDKIVFTGFLSDEELSGLMESCLAVVFPSLYEGFGMPVIEAMAFGKPVLCSNVTSLPEIAGNAALLFDPRKPEEIAAAIARIQTDRILAARLAEKGQQRVSMFGGADEMARQYIQVFRDAMDRPGGHVQGFYGVYSDGWTSDRVQIAYDANPEERYLEMSLCLPAWSPISRVNALVVSQTGNAVPSSYVIRRGHATSVRLPLSSDGGLVEFSLIPTFQPRIHGLGNDVRALGCQCQECFVVSRSGKKNLLESGIDQTWQSLPQ